MSLKGTADWNFFFSGWITYVAQGGQQTLRTMAEPNAVFTPPDKKDPPQFMKDFDEVSNGTTLEARKAAFADAQKLAFEDVMVIPDRRHAEGAGRARQRRALHSVLQSAHVQRMGQAVMTCMGRIMLTGLGLAAGLATANAAPFKCPHVGGNFTFGQEANINSLDQMTSARSRRATSP